MRVTKKDNSDTIIINGMKEKGRRIFYKDDEDAIYEDLEVIKLQNIEFHNFYFIRLNSSSFINKLKNSLTVLKYVWSK